jgi:hypothetical protein
MMRRSPLSGFSWLWARRTPEPIIAAQQRRRLGASAVLTLVVAIVVIIAQMDVHAPDIARVPVILGLVLTPAVGHAYICIARRLTDGAESVVIVAASGVAHVTAASALLGAVQPSLQAAIADRAGLALRLAGGAYRAALDALRAAARVSHVAIAPRMTSRALGAAA